MYHIKRKDAMHPIMKQNVSYAFAKTAPVALGQGCGANNSNMDFGSNTALEYLTFPTLEALDFVEHLISTRFGGVSEGELSYMNLSFTRGDREENVVENYRRIGQLLCCEPQNMVASHQTHTTNIRRVTEADRGKGITVARDYEEVDGLITNEPGICLVTYYADCVPLLFVDTVNRAIGLAHSGWRGTVNKMAHCMVKAMQEQFRSNPADICVAIGPSICQECYEVSEDVATEFVNAFGQSRDSSRVSDIVLPGRTSGKYQLNLWLANECILLESGILKEHIAVTDICTCCNSQYLFSHRASGGRRGNIAAFLMLKDGRSR